VLSFPNPDPHTEETSGYAVLALGMLTGGTAGIGLGLVWVVGSLMSLGWRRVLGTGLAIAAMLAFYALAKVTGLDGALWALLALS